MAKAKTPNKKLMHTIIALVIWAIFKWLIPAPEPMTDTGMEIVGVFIMATYLWITVETGWTSILVVSMVAISGAMSATAAIKGSFGDWMFAFLMACMLVNHVLSETGISRRIAVWFITRKFVKGRPYIIVLMFFAAMFVLGLGMTSSATCVMFLALAKEILDTCGYDRKDKFSQFLFCCIAAITIAGNGMTAIGHGNFITGIAGRKNFSVITITKNGMSNEVGVLRRILEVLEKYQLVLEYLPSGIDSVSLVVAADKLRPCQYQLLGDIQKMLKPDSIHVTDDMAIVAAVGRKMAFKPGTSGKIFAALGENGINIRMITQGPDELNIIVGVDNKDFAGAIRVLYDSFVK